MNLRNTHLLTAALLLGSCLCASAANPSALMLPDPVETPRMTKWMDYRYGLFIHFNINTYMPGQHVPVPPPATKYAPTALDVDSWVKLARDAGMNYAVLTTKHDGGFCLWDSKVPWKGREFEYDVAASRYPTDVVRAFVDACKNYDVAPGFYYCLADSYANKSEKIPKLFQMGVMPEDAFELAKAQLAELATNYPECHYYWLDTPQTASLDQKAAIYDLLRRKHPDNVVLMNQHLAGPKKPGERGAQTGEQSLLEKERPAGYPEPYPVDLVNSEYWQRPHGVVSRIQNWKGKQLFMGYEHCGIAGSGWFKTTNPKSVAELFGLYKQIRNAGGNLLLNVGPTPAGTMPSGFRPMLLQLKKQIDVFETPPPPKAAPERVEAWQDLRFGMFVHWGPASLTGHEISMSRGKETPIAKYDNLYRSFNPTAFQAEEWIRICKAAGMKYFVITAKHVDGFCLWDTKLTDYNILQTPFHRDVTRELADACRKDGVAFGIYYQDHDWYHPSFPGQGYRGRTPRPGASLPRYHAYMEGQLTELVKQYGPLLTLWFDGPSRPPFIVDGERIYRFTRSLQPDMLINDRTGNRKSPPGDYRTTEQMIAGFENDRPWETCMTLGGQWSWKPGDANLKPAPEEEPPTIDGF